MAVSVPDVVRLRMTDPAAVRERLRARQPYPGPRASENLLVIAADHPARGALAAGDDPMAMANRGDLLERIVTALSRPGVSGFLGTAEVVEDLALLGALDGKMVFGSMNRGGLAGASFELDDRFTGYDARGVAAAGLDGEHVPLDIAVNAESYGLKVLVAKSIDDFRAAYREAAASDRATVIHVDTDLFGPNPPASAWWDVPVSEVSALPSTQRAREDYLRAKSAQRTYL